MASPPRCRPPATTLTEDLVEEIVLRFPPDDPACLFRAAVVCKVWRRLICSPDFRRRFREFHRGVPPLLGLICRRPYSVRGVQVDCTDFMPTTSTFRQLPSSSSVSKWRWRAMDTLHGRVLFSFSSLGSPRARFMVWSPVPSEVRTLPDFCINRYRNAAWSAALLCAQPGCDHVDCSTSGAFLVVLAGINSSSTKTTSAYVYSSERGTWSDGPVASMEDYALSGVTGVRRPGPLVGNTLYFACSWYDLRAHKLLAYDLSKQRLSCISLPFAAPYRDDDDSDIALFTADEGRKLGVAAASAQQYKLFMWSRKNDDGAGGLDRDDAAAAAWTQDRVFQLDMLLPFRNLALRYRFFSAKENPGAIVIVVGCIAVFTLDLKSARVTKLLEGFNETPNSDDDIVPYVCFSTPS